jgi:hypothetical protein
MQLTIDSNQPLEDVLRVIGAMYNVELSTQSGTRAPTRASRNNPAPRPTRRGRANGRRTRQPTTAEVRGWALSHGYEVGSKGRIPDAVLQAYRASNR